MYTYIASRLGLRTYKRYVCISQCVCAYVPVVCVRAYGIVYTHLSLHSAYMHACVVSTHTYIHEHSHTFKFMNMHTYIQTYDLTGANPSPQHTENSHKYSSKVCNDFQFVSKGRKIALSKRRKWNFEDQVCVCVCTHICVCVYIYIYICIYMCAN